MKKILVIALAALLASASVFAAVDADDYSGSMVEGELGVGLNLGTTTGVALKYGYGPFDVFTNIGVDFVGLGRHDCFSLGIELGASWEVYDVDFGKGHHMPITVGALVPVGLIFDDDFTLGLGFLAQAGVEYQIPDWPISFYLRLGLGLGFDLISDFECHFDGSGAIGALYMF